MNESGGVGLKIKFKIVSKSRFLTIVKGFAGVMGRRGG